MIEKLHGNSNTSELADYLEKGHERSEKVAEYLANEKNIGKEERVLHFQGVPISAEDSKKIIESFKTQGMTGVGVIYSPNPNSMMAKIQLEMLADRIIQEKEKEIGAPLKYMVATHMQTDAKGNVIQHPKNHIHILFFSKPEAIEKLKEGIKKPTKEWLDKRYQMEHQISDKAPTEHEQNIQAKRMVSRGVSGTVKRDNFILQHVNSKTGEISLKRIERAMREGKNQRLQQGSQKKLKEIRGRLNGLVKLGMAQKIDDHHYKLDIEKYSKFLEKQGREQAAKKFQKRIDAGLHVYKDMHKAMEFANGRIDTRAAKTTFLHGDRDKEIKKLEIEIQKEIHREAGFGLSL